MSEIVARIADDLAREALELAADLQDDDLVGELARVIGAGSTTTQEAFMTAVRIRMAETRARDWLAARRARGAEGR